MFDDVVASDPDLTLRWPAALFAVEATRLLQRPAHERGTRAWTDEVELLLTEAFAGAVAAQRFRDLGGGPMSSLAALSPKLDLQLNYVRRLIDSAEQLPVASEPRPVWSERHGQRGPAPTLDWKQTAAAFIDIIEDLDEWGYLGNAFPNPCVDDKYRAEPQHSRELQRRVGVADLWPLRESRRRWQHATLLDLVEVFDDLVMRPARRTWHDYYSCGWHYSGFTRTTAQLLYRWRINQLLATSDLGLRLAMTGEDAGRLVTVTDSPRSELVDRMINRTDESTGDRVRHAISLFRGRGADAETKRSAALALAGVLEERRQLLKAKLLTQDERDLFNIANNFAIRHRNQMQRSDYDAAFLAWIFWWYLATLELTDRLLARSGP